MNNYTEDIYKFIQEHYLWQFHSRSWDRDANINGILGLAYQLLVKDVISLQTPAERCFYADAITFVKDIKKNFPEFLELGPEGIEGVIKSLKAKLHEIVIDKCLNLEVNAPNY
jgi:vanadium nitrogenase delta subunit